MTKYNLSNNHALTNAQLTQAFIAIKNLPKITDSYVIHLNRDKNTLTYITNEAANTAPVLNTSSLLSLSTSSSISPSSSFLKFTIVKATDNNLYILHRSIGQDVKLAQPLPFIQSCKSNETTAIKEYHFVALKSENTKHKKTYSLITEIYSLTGLDTLYFNKQPLYVSLLKKIAIALGVIEALEKFHSSTSLNGSVTLADFMLNLTTLEISILDFHCSTSNQSQSSSLANLLTDIFVTHSADCRKIIDANNILSFINQLINKLQINTQPLLLNQLLINFKSCFLLAYNLSKPEDFFIYEHSANALAKELTMQHIPIKPLI